MCELLALSSSHPARLTFSLHALAARGGLAGKQHDGWGVAFCQGTDVALFREPAGAADGLAAAGAGVEGEPEVFDCANAKLALPATTRAVNAWVKKLETFMGTFEVAALGSV